MTIVFIFGTNRRYEVEKPAHIKTHHIKPAVYVILVCKHRTNSINIQKLLTFVQYNQIQNHLEMLTLRFLL